MAPEEQKTMKRKLQDDDKPRKKQKKQKKVRDDEGDLDVEAGLNRAFERMDGQLIADHIAKKTQRFGTDLSPIELADLYISGEQLPQSLSRPSPQWERGGWGERSRTGILTSIFGRSNRHPRQHVMAEATQSGEPASVPRGFRWRIREARKLPQEARLATHDHRCGRRPPCGQSG